jgi:hypothetical protein
MHIAYNSIFGDIYFKVDNVKNMDVVKISGITLIICKNSIKNILNKMVFINYKYIINIRGVYKSLYSFYVSFEILNSVNILE